MRSGKFLIMGIIMLVWSFNSSLLSGPPKGETRVIAQMGAHQTFPVEDAAGDACTATRIDAPVHAYLENTVDGMQAAFAAGADVVGIDVQLTADGALAVFGDRMLDCRTDGSGETAQTPMNRLKSLDIGYGYTADGGATFPFRGRGTGLLPSLDELLAANPAGRLLVNFAGDNEADGRAFAALVEANPGWREKIFAVHGAEAPVGAATAALPGLMGYTEASNRSCLLQYIATGWIGHVPDACRGTVVLVPRNYAPLLWGWPHKMMIRMQEAGSELVVYGSYGAGAVKAGIDTPDQVSRLPSPLAGNVLTNRVLETAGPIKQRER